MPDCWLYPRVLGPGCTSNPPPAIPGSCILGISTLCQLGRPAKLTMATTNAQQVKEELVAVCLATWHQRAQPMTLEDWILLSVQFEETVEDDLGTRLEGALVSDDNPKGYLLVPFDSSPTQDSELSKRRRELAMIHQKWPALVVEVDALLTKEIGENEFFQLEASPEPQSLPILKKVCSSSIIIIALDGGE